MSRKANMRIPLLVLLIWLIGMLDCVAFGSFDAERRALLDFKTGLNDPGNLLSSWHGQNCCDWWGVACDKSTGHVVKLNLIRNPYKSFYNSSYYSLSGKIDPSLLNLRQLTHLDLSGHNFSSTSIPGFIGSFENLIYLNVSWSMFSGVIPYQLGNLSKLRYLDLSYSSFSGTIPTQLGNLSNLQFLNLASSLEYITAVDISWISRLSSLRYLDMSSVNLTAVVDWSEFKNKPYLETLILSGCSLGNIPAFLSPVNFTSLQKLEITDNSFDTTIPSWFWNLTNLLCLELGDSNFHGGIPDGLSNLDSLNYLDLSYNNFKPISFEPLKKLCNLRNIGLSYLNIGGNIADVVKRLSCSWYNLESVRLSENNLQGNISSWIAEMRNLSFLDLSDNALSGPLSPEIGTLTNLMYLDLSQNSLSGVMTEAHFINVSKLKKLYLYDNLLNMEVSDKWIPPFQLNVLILSSCRLGPRFPSWLRWQTQLGLLFLSNTSIEDIIPNWFRNLPLKYLDLSYNNIDVIPNWLWNLPLIYLDLSYNNIRGNLPLSLQFSNIHFLSLRSNYFEGPFPDPPAAIMVLDLSNNNLSGPFPTKMEIPSIGSLFLSNNRINGSIPSGLRDTQYLFQLSLSNNTLSGEIPSCWKNSISLNMMDLSNNNLTGELPASIGMLTYLKILQLDNNKLYGEIPSTLQQCKYLTFLGLGRNNFSGKIPAWIGESLENLVIIQLRSNIFSGYIPPELGQLARLQILDLAHNNLLGCIPYSFGNFSAMRNTSQYFHSEYFTEFHFEIGYVTFSIDLFEGIKGEAIYSFKPLDHAKSIDLSGNNLSGQIPIEIGLLKDLINLNLSQNHLIGRIPESIGNIQSLESLDLSFNELSGPIPLSLSDLFMLNYLNLSYNNLSGKIPSGRQLDTLIDPSIYTGNTYICGPPTNKTCFEDKEITIDGGTVNNGYEMIWLYCSIGLGFIFGFWGIFGVLIFRKTWHIAYFQMLDKLFDDIYVKLVLTMRRLKHVRG